MRWCSRTTVYIPAPGFVMEMPAPPAPPAPPSPPAPAPCGTRLRLQVLYLCALTLFALGTLTFFLIASLQNLGTSTAATRARTQKTIHYGARLLFFLLKKLSLLELSTSGFPATGLTKRPAVVVANHPSMLDAMLLLSLLPNAVCIMKPTLLRIPGVAGLARRAGYIPYGTAPDVLQSATQALRSGSSIIIFPEGTRSAPDRMGAFQRGAVRIALEAHAPIHAVALQMAPVVLGRGSPWWRAPTAVVRYHATLLETSANPGLAEQGSPTTEILPEHLRARCTQRTKELEDLLRISLY